MSFASLSRTQLHLGQIKQQHFGVIYSRQLQRFFRGDRRSIAFGQFLALSFMLPRATCT